MSIERVGSACRTVGGSSFDTTRVLVGFVSTEGSVCTGSLLCSIITIIVCIPENRRFAVGIYGVCVGNGLIVESTIIVADNGIGSEYDGTESFLHLFGVLSVEREVLEDFFGEYCCDIVFVYVRNIHSRKCGS